METVKSKKYSTDLVRMELDPVGFVRVTLLESTTRFDLIEAKRQEVIARELVGDEKVLVLVDTTNSYAVPSLQAIKHIASLPFKTAEAVVIKSLGHRIIARQYLRLIKQRYPSKLFSNEEDAVEWLMTFKRKEKGG